MDTGRSINSNEWGNIDLSHSTVHPTNLSSSSVTPAKLETAPKEPSPTLNVTEIDDLFWTFGYPDRIPRIL